MKEKIKKLYINFVRTGQIEEAQKILELLNKCKVNLNGLDDATWNVQMALEEINCPFHYGRQYQLYAYFKEEIA